MPLKKYRWSRVYESAEEELLHHLEVHQVSPVRQAADFAETYEAASSPEGSRLWCAEGSFNLTVGPDSISMQPGDAIKLPPDTAYQINPGINGCAWYSA